jgi:hypothetical protein
MAAMELNLSSTSSTFPVSFVIKIAFVFGKLCVQYWLQDDEGSTWQLSRSLFGSWIV